MRKRFGHDGLFWRRLAHLGATRGPTWWVRYSPPFFGLAAAALVPSARRSVAHALVQTRGESGRVRDTIDVARTFMNYAGCLAESLAMSAENADQPEATIVGDHEVLRCAQEGRGMVFVTAHTAGWDACGPLLARDHGLRLMVAMQAEPDAAARALHDEARVSNGLRIVHVGDDPLASLALLKHVRAGGVAALQLDRVLPGMRARSVRLFGAPGAIPEGPLRIAQLARVPVIPVFCARLGFRKYVVELADSVEVAPRATPAELDAAAQALADAMSSFLRRHPTQWLRFS
jgi:phosphatidylinositol dimannoside acyltransferase